MKTHTIKSRTMRTLLIILLFVSGFAFAQPSINNPTSLQVCDDGNDGFENFNLFSKNAEVLGSLNASNHTVSYHETLVDAENNLNALPSVYSNIVNNQIIYVRVIENSSPTLFSTTTLTLEAVSYPLIIPMSNVTVCESYTLPVLPFGQNYYTGPNGTGSLIPVGVTITSTQTIYIFAQTLTIPPCTSESSFTVTVNPIPTYSTPPNLIQFDTDGTAGFNLTVQNSSITLDPTYSISYFTSFANAESGTANIVNSTFFTNTSNPQTIYARVINPASGCYSITSFDLIVNTNPFPINNPTPLQVCDDNNDTFGVFDLTTKESEILGALNPSDYSVTFFASFGSAQANTNMITNPTSYVNVSIYTQTIGVRVTNTTTGEYAVTTLDLIVNPTPSITQPPNLVQNSNTGSAVFDLTVQTNNLEGGTIPYNVGYFLSNTDALANANEIITPAAFINYSNPQTIYARVEDSATGCFSITNFDLIVNTNPFPINNPTTLYACDNNNDGYESFNLTTKNAEILGTLNPLDYTVSYHETATDAQAGSNSLTSPYINVSFFNQTIYVRVTENANPTTFSTTTLEINATALPFIATTVPNLTVTENPFDGVATFNLTTQNNYITTIPTQVINFYTTQTDADTLSNPISNPSSFTGNHLQVIWFSLTEPSTGCSTISSFTLNVVDSGNVVYIPDTNFKSLLLNSNSTSGVAANSSFQPIQVDLNLDGEIQFSEALLVYSLDILGQNINTIEGISAFTNLGWFRCSNNNLTSVDLSANINLNRLQIGQNQLTSLNVSMLTNLVWLICDNNFLTSLNVLPLVNLEEFNCSNNQLTSINISSLSNIYTLDLSYNQLSSVNLNGVESVVQLILQNNQLASIDLSMLTQVDALYLGNNNLTTIDISNLQSTSIIDLSYNNLTTIDATQNAGLNFIGCSNNNLESLFVKNGMDESNFNNQNIFSNNPSLSFICADDFQVQSIQDNLNAIGNTTCTVNSYCSFTPGGDFNTLTGTATFDVNNNGCDASDIPFDLLSLNVSLNGISTNSSVITNNSGVYSLFTNIVGEYQLTPNFENPTFYNVSPVVQLFPVIDNSTATQNFCITANGAHPDLEIVIAPITPARPGFDALYQIVYKNKGNQTLSGSYTFNYDDEKLDFISATVIPNTFTTGILTWNYTNLMPFENRTVYVTLNVNSPVEIPAVNIGDIFTFSSTINPITGDETPSDNTFTYAQTVVGSYDPNDITCTEGQTVVPSEIGEYLHYIVNFENTGNYYAENVVVKIEIDETKYDVSSLQLLNTSSESKSKITNNVVEFIFEGINLAAASGNPPVGGHGNVLFKIKSKNNLVTGDMVQKTAKIYFDYNAPIETNLSQTTYQSLNNPIFEFDESVKVFPNPTQSKININSNFNIKSVELYDVQGRLLEKSFENNSSITLDISERQNGIYFVKITSDKGSKIEKVIKN